MLDLDLVLQIEAEKLENTTKFPKMFKNIVDLFKAPQELTDDEKQEHKLKM